METVDEIHRRYAEMYLRSVQHIEKTYHFNEAENMVRRVGEQLRIAMEGELIRIGHL